MYLYNYFYENPPTNMVAHPSSKYLNRRWTVYITRTKKYLSATCTHKYIFCVTIYALCSLCIFLPACTHAICIPALHTGLGVVAQDWEWDTKKNLFFFKLKS